MLGLGEQTPYTQIQDITIAKEPYEKLWYAAVKFHAYHDKWMNGPLLKVNAEEVEEEVNLRFLLISIYFYSGQFLLVLLRKCFLFCSSLYLIGPDFMENSLQVNEALCTPWIQRSNEGSSHYQRQARKIQDQHATNKRFV